MNRRVWTGTCAAIVSVATAGMLAQTAGQPPASPQSTPSSSDKKVTVTGCLKAAPSTPSDTASAANPNPTGTPGATGTGGSTTPATAGTGGTAGAPTTPTAAPDARFILTAAIAAPADAAGGASTANNASAADTAQTYRLIANPNALSEHVGKKLELTGTIDPTSTADPKDPSTAAPALRVESGKIIAASCSE
ncbi:MAG: hypothetical protein JWL71_1051 [Acidobacteria bacterium]|nr:hypothetical protein [Acidobacteriota bacterium]